MANLTENKLNLILSDIDVNAIVTSIKAAKAKIPVVNLTDEQRNSKKSMDVDNKVFVQDTIVEMRVNGTGIIPEFIKPEFVQNDLTLFEQLDEIESELLSMLRLVIDAKRVAADEALTVTNAMYRIFEFAALAGIPGAKEAFDKLKVRYEKQGGNGGGKPEAPKP